MREWIRICSILMGTYNASACPGFQKPNAPNKLIHAMHLIVPDKNSIIVRVGAHGTRVDPASAPERSRSFCSWVQRPEYG